jgi:hypothetical protein
MLALMQADAPAQLVRVAQPGRLLFKRVMLFDNGSGAVLEVPAVDDVSRCPEHGPRGTRCDRAGKHMGVAVARRYVE